jgi:ATP-dependent Clp protease ATP-binding subunit ClpA
LKKVEQTKPLHEKVPGPREIPLSNASKRALTFASEEANMVSNRRICTEHLLLGLLREEKCFAAEILSELGVQFASIREELSRIPHDDSKTDEFVIERTTLPQDVVELQTRIRSIKTRLEDAIASHDFAHARVHRTKRLRNVTS